MTDPPLPPIFLDPGVRGPRQDGSEPTQTRLHLSVPHPMLETAGSWTWKACRIACGFRDLVTRKDPGFFMDRCQDQEVALGRLVKHWVPLVKGEEY